MSESRYIEADVRKDLAHKMVFISGPRQVGKTTLSQKILKEYPQGKYYNWDNTADRKQILASVWPAEKTLVVLDEIHKYKFWKRWLKGEYDKYKPLINFLVTGSARLDVYRKGGDSLLGRYHHYRLHPLSYSELLEIKADPTPGKELVFTNDTNQAVLADLLQFGGFPEPFFLKDVTEHRRWIKQRVDLLLREDVRDLDRIHDLSLLQILTDILPDRAGRPLSLNSLREDLQVSHRTVTNWMLILEKLYYCYRVPPFFTSKFRSLRKEAKVFLWDWSTLEDQGSRLENLVASHLLKTCHWLEDHGGYRVKLHYLRDVNKREVDFLVTINEKPWFAVEVKKSDTTLSPYLHYFGERLKIPYLYQVVLETDQDVLNNNVRILPVSKFLTALK